MLKCYVKYGSGCRSKRVDGKFTFQLMGDRWWWRHVFPPASQEAVSSPLALLTKINGCLCIFSLLLRHGSRSSAVCSSHRLLRCWNNFMSLKHVLNSDLPTTPTHVCSGYSEKRWHSSQVLSHRVETHNARQFLNQIHRPPNFIHNTI